MWGRFVDAVQLLVQHFDARLTVGTNAIPMAVPHTRPTGLTAHGSRKELVAEHPAWVGTVQVPGSASALIEYRLGSSGAGAGGFPPPSSPYLPQGAYPPAAAALLRAVAGVGGLTLPLAALDTSSEEAL